MGDQITFLEPHQVFVFGSNLAGRHGKGAAKFALKFGAKYGEGIGHRGQSYGIPIKYERIRTLPLAAMKEHVDAFLQYAAGKPQLQFLVTEVGCGLAGYTPEEIGPLFRKQPLANVVLPERFKS